MKFKGGKEPRIKKHPPSYCFDWESQVATDDGMYISDWELRDKFKKERTMNSQEAKMRTFEGGATRDNDDTKCDYEGFLSPLVFRRFGKYMNKHRIQADGKKRESDNWQKGIPISAYMKSWWRHFMDVWFMWRRVDRPCPGVEELKDWSKESLDEISDLLCAALFNNMGMLHEIEKERRSRA